MNPLIGGLLTICVIGFFTWLNRWANSRTEQNQTGQENEAPTSLVLLQDEPSQLDLNRVTNLIKQTFDEETARSVAMLPEKDRITAYLFTRDQRIFGILVSDHRYFKEVDPDNEHGALPLRAPARAQIEAHRAWVSVDLFAPKDAPGEQVEQVLGKVASALLDSHSLLLYAPHLELASVPTHDTAAGLVGPNPFQVLTSLRSVVIVKAESDDPELLAAQEEAQKKWPEFVSAWEKRVASQRFFVKTTFVEGEHTEHMWIMIRGLKKDQAVGMLDNDPKTIQGLKAGDQVRIPISSVEDWLYLDREGKPMGGFSANVLERRKNAEPSKSA